MTLTPRQSRALQTVALEAARAIMARRGAAPEIKADGSPVTSADLAANAILMQALPQIVPSHAVVSEESPPPEQPGDAVIFLDPLDGTKDFAAGRNEFCISIGGVHGGVPVWGLLCAPALRRLWIGHDDTATCYVLDANLRACTQPEKLTPQRSGDNVTAVFTRSHPHPAIAPWLEKMGIAEGKPVGSAVKFARIAEGAAAFYPCFSTLQPWDIAGGHALVRAAGGAVIGFDGCALHYQAGSSMQPFIALGCADVAAQAARAASDCVSSNSMGLPK